MAFKDFRQKHKKTFDYISKIFSKACIVILVCIALFFVIYFVESFIARSKGEKYYPRISLYTIISPSMVPSVNVYDIVVDAKITDFSKIKEGDVITFISSSNVSVGLTVTHRVTRIKTNEDGSYEFYTKGDNNAFEDGATAKSADIIGKVLFKIPQLGRVQFLLTSPLGWLCCILIPAIIIIAFDLNKLFKVLKMNEQGKVIAAGNVEVKLTPEEIKANIMANREVLNNMIKNNNEVKPENTIVNQVAPQTIMNTTKTEVAKTEPVIVQNTPVSPPPINNETSVSVQNVVDEIPPLQNSIDDDLDLPKLK